MNGFVFDAVGVRAASDGAFREALQSAWRRGGMAAAAQVARAHGFEVPFVQDTCGELSDLDLEQVAGGKGPVWIGGPLPIIIW